MCLCGPRTVRDLADLASPLLVTCPFQHIIFVKFEHVSRGIFGITFASELERESKVFWVVINYLCFGFWKLLFYCAFFQ